MLELAGNLLDNACKWARSEARIRVEAQPAPALIVEDDGPGVPPEHREALTRRGVRLDEAAEGFGLGLAIVGDLVAAYRGRLDLETSADLGGLAVRVTLPAESLSRPS
nr:ATP-binding protein [Halorhodospira neutriphila]